MKLNNPFLLALFLLAAEASMSSTKAGKRDMSMSMDYMDDMSMSSIKAGKKGMSMSMDMSMSSTKAAKAAKKSKGAAKKKAKKGKKVLESDDSKPGPKLQKSTKAAAAVQADSEE
jgi:hypothetical protein